MYKTRRKHINNIKDANIILFADSENLNHIDGRQTSCGMYQVGQLETLPDLSFRGSAIHNCCRLNVGQGS